MSTAFESKNRSISATFQYYYTSSWYTLTTEVKSVSLSESFVSNNCITMGTINSSTLKVDFVNVSDTIKGRLTKGTKCKVSLTVTASGYTSSTVNLGLFYIDELSWTKSYSGYYNGNITAYDGMSLFEKEYTVPSGSTLHSVANVAEDLAKQVFGSSSYSSYYDSSAFNDSTVLTTLPEGVTCRVMLGYLAGFLGKCAYFDRNGKMSAKWYSTYSKTINRDEQYMDGVSLNSDTVTIITLQSGTSETTITAPTTIGDYGTCISFENPIMTQAQLTSIYNSKVSGNLISFTPLSVKWRGDPNITLGSIITVQNPEKETSTTYTCYVMERNLTYDGGLYEEYKCYAENEKSISFTSNPTMTNINRKLTKMEEAIENATSVIAQTEGSIFEFIEDDNNPGQNIGFKLYSETNDYVITGVNTGIGFSTDGGSTQNAAAIYMDSQGGHINGNYIVANSIYADSLTVGQETNLSGLSGCTSETYTSNPYKFKKNNTLGTHDWLYSHGLDTNQTIYIGANRTFNTSDAFHITATISHSAKYSSTGLKLGIGFQANYSDGTSSFFNLSEQGVSNDNYISYSAETKDSEGNVTAVSFTTVDYYAVLKQNVLTTTKTISSIKPIFFFKNSSYDTVTPTSGSIYVKDIWIRGTNTGAGVITAGKLQSYDGYSYFDLTQGEIAARGVNMKVLLGTSAVYDTSLEVQGLFYLNKDTALASTCNKYGLLTFDKVTSGSTNYYTTHLYSNGYIDINCGNGIAFKTGDYNSEWTGMESSGVKFITDIISIQSNVTSATNKLFLGVGEEDDVFPFGNSHISFVGSTSMSHATIYIDSDGYLRIYSNNGRTEGYIAISSSQPY